MSGPILRAILESGDSYADPSEDLLFELLGEVDRGDALWIIVEKTADSSGQTYVQAVRLEDRSFMVERRRGTPESHESVQQPDARAAHALLTQWAFAL